jgi:tRNA splicing endonuclease
LNNSPALIQPHRVHYHGIVNTEEDDVSKIFGSDLLPDELKFFSDLIQKLLENNYLSTDDIYRFKNDKWKGSQTDVVLEKLRERGWLQRDSRSFWEIGTYTA